jgi:hypothetical protein
MTTMARTRAPTIVVAVAAAIAIIGVIVSVRQAAAAFLVAYVAAVSAVLGVLAMTMIAHLTTATWFGVMRRRALRMLDALPALAALGILVLLALPVLYRWVGVPQPAGLGVYLNVPFFVVRFLIYWGAWIAIARALQATARIEASGDIARATRRYRRISAAGLVILGFTMTFAAFDWMMSLTPEWFSTIYGVYWFAGAMIGGLSLLAWMAASLGDDGLDVVGPDHIHAIAKLLLTFILFWLYIGFSQYIVIWSGDIPREVTWYVARVRGGWAGVAIVLLFGTFVFPFLLLLVRAAKRNQRVVAAIGVVLLALHYLDAFWVVMPGLVPVTWWTLVLAAAMLVVVVAPSAVLASRSTV